MILNLKPSNTTLFEVRPIKICYAKSGRSVSLQDDDIWKTQREIILYKKNFCRVRKRMIENLFIFGDFSVDLMKKLFVNWRWKLKTNVCSVGKSFPG